MIEHRVEAIADLSPGQCGHRDASNGATVGGQIHFTAGRPIRASTDDGRVGEDAVLALLKETDGTFSIDTTPKDFGPSKITRNFSDFVLSDFFDSEAED